MQLTQYTFKSLGREGVFNAPALVEDIERITGQKGVCQEAFFTQYAYQDRNVAMRQNVAKAVEEFTGIPRKSHQDTNKKTGEQVTVYDETEQDYINRLMLPDDEKKVALSEADFARIWNEQNEFIGDWQPSVGSERKPAKPFYDLADDLLGKIAAGSSTLERVIANLEAKLNVSFAAAFGDPNRDNIARAIKAFKEKEDRERASALLS